LLRYVAPDQEKVKSSSFSFSFYLFIYFLNFT